MTGMGNLLVVLLLALGASGCASVAERDASRAEAEKARAAAIKVAQSFADYKKEATEAADKLKQELTASKAVLDTTRSERDQHAEAFEALRREAATLKQDLGEMASLRAETARLTQELAAVQRQLHAEAASPPVVVTTTLVPPPDVEEKLRRLQDEARTSADDRRRLERRAEELEESLTAARRAEAEAVQKSAEPIRIRIVDRLLFDSGEADLRAGGCGVLKRVAERLRQAPDFQIHIEGHTDSKPPKPSLRSRYPSNWELSSARATNVLRCLIREGRLPADRLLAVGYGATRPVAGNETEEGRRRNRRVEIVLYPVAVTEVAKDSAP